jgi:hypothetical protein
MAACSESLTIEQGKTLISVCKGLKVNHAHRGGVNPSLFLEIGRLHKEIRTLRSHRRRFTVLKGQITFMIESDWRVEKPRSIQVGSGFSDRQIDRMLKTLIGRRVVAASVVGRLPELQIELDDGRLVSTFTNWTNQPRWSVGFKDARLFELRSLPAAEISPWMHFQKGRLEVEYCFDDSNPATTQFVQQLRKSR